MRRSLFMLLIALVLVAYASQVRPGPTVAVADDGTWPPLLAAGQRDASGDLLTLTVEVTNRSNRALSNILLHIPPPAPGAMLANCWAGGGAGANPCAANRADNVAKWDHPSLAAGRTLQFSAQFRIPDPGSVAESAVWYRWQGQPPGEYTALFRTALPVGASDTLTAPRVRKNACNLTDQEKADYVQAVLELKRRPYPGSELSIYDTFVKWHRDAFDMDIMAAHMAPAFLPWHRVYLHRFEDELRKINPRITLPYWDWTGTETPRLCVFTDDFMGGDGDQSDQGIVKTGPFRQGEWRLTILDPINPDNPPNLLPWLTRGFGTFVPLGADLPAQAEVLRALGISTYDLAPWSELTNYDCSFRQNLEGWRPGANPKQDRLHNQVHLYVGGDTRNNGGTMTENTSPNDPVFFLHHANVDRIWAQWERIHGSTYLPTSGFRQGQNLDDRMWPWFEQRPADVLGRAGLGYVYESETRATPRQQLVAVSPPCGGPAPGTIRPSAAHTESMPGSAP